MTEIKDFMVANGISNRVMSEMCGVTQRTVINWTMGNKKTPMSVTLLMDGVKSGPISLDWWKEQAKRSKGEQ